MLEIALPYPAYVCVTVNQLCTHPWAVSVEGVAGMESMLLGQGVSQIGV